MHQLQKSLRIMASFLFHLPNHFQESLTKEYPGEGILSSMSFDLFFFFFFFFVPRSYIETSEDFLMNSEQ